MLDSQQMSCSICKTHVSKLGKTLSIDHCHSTGAVRELLCSSCNSLLGFSKENVDILKSAIEYISKHNKNRQA